MGTEYPLHERPRQNVQSLPFYRTQQVPKKKNPLILNMIVEIDIPTVKLSKRGKFFIRFRPYGDKETIKLGPQL